MKETTIAIAARDTVPSAPVAPHDGERQRCEIWTRVMGYHRPVSSFNRGKKGEFHERLYFTEERTRHG
ncbi:hypothetical protein FHS82_003620 [Pseudochelatococcus lubricantis]|uniref:Uncharacterized protein n=1 Tax=Pseudochelatococcus lubricantis TaxID=1538102 RepID=A0ABX0V5I5_9HYPH|nr:anaerobic ribonucleoside-triphosphate reductase [Pseudochelatococcus lubricantis]NIJ59759.1 hypothetical protein [Pseudochelatococcus lubricantis]